MMIVLLKKTAKVLILLILVSFASFLIICLAPSDAAQVMLEADGNLVTEETLAAKRAELGLDRPLLIRYAGWLGKAVRGDLGESFKSNKSVASELAQALPNTMLLTVLSTVLAFLIAVPAGISGAQYKSGVLDRILGVATYILISFPSFFVSLVVLYVFALKLRWFNVIGGSDPKDAVLPIFVLAITSAAWMTRQVRTLILKEYAKDYVLACRARGASERRILWKHVLKNCMLPISTLVGILFAANLGGTLIVENVFNWAGLGQLIIKSVTYRDYLMIHGYVIFMSPALLAVNAVIDLLYTVFDPRLREGAAKKGA